MDMPRRLVELLGRQSTNDYAERLAKVYWTVAGMAPALPYHNMPHMADVSNMAGVHAARERLGKHKTFLLQTTGLVHDGVYIVGRYDNEVQTVRQLVYPLLPSIGYSPDETETVARLTLRTEPNAVPRDIMEMIIRDADIDAIGRPDMMEKSENLRHEFGVDEVTWWTRTCPDFIDSARFYTRSAERLRGAGLKYNRRMLREFGETF